MTYSSDFGTGGAGVGGPPSGMGDAQPPDWPPYGWSYPAPGGPPDRKGSRTGWTVGLVALLALGAAVFGAGVGHAVWPSNAAPVNVASSGTGPAAPAPNGAVVPSDPASIAARVDRGVVDIDVADAYQNLQAAGTGMVLTSNGEVLTNNHVIEGATEIRVSDIGNGRTYSAKVVGYDRSADVAVIQLSGASGLATVRTSSGHAKVGQGVVAVGNAGGTGGVPSYAAGSVNALNQSITASDQAEGTSENLSGLIETDADIVPGDSGGPLVNSAGRVIGMDTAASSSFQFQGQSQTTQGFAIPIATATSIARQIESGRASTAVHVGPTAFLGVTVQDVSGGLGGGPGGGSGQAVPGAQIAGVVSGGPAATAGLVPGDTIISLNGTPVASAQALTALMLAQRPGEAAQVGYQDANGVAHTLTVRLGSGPPQ
jgi:S1-C subfamily serine protease